MNINYKMIVVMRHPIETIFSWHRSNRGDRYGCDQRMPHPTFNLDGKFHIPSFAINRYEEYFKSTPLERCCIAIIELTHQYLNSFKVNPNASLNLDFDYITINPMPVVEDLCKYLTVKPSTYTEVAINKARMPQI